MSPEQHSPGDHAAAHVTELLAAARAGQDGAEDALYDAVYHDLKRLARAQLGRHGRVGATLDTTALVHEAYLRLAGPAGGSVDDRRHYFNLAARVMRHVIVDAARQRDAAKRGAGVAPLPLDEALTVAPAAAVSDDVLAVDRALTALEAASPELARLVELRFFAGLTVEELVPLTGRSERSLKRDWRRAQAFLVAAVAGRPLELPVAGGG